MPAKESEPAQAWVLKAGEKGRRAWHRMLADKELALHG